MELLELEKILEEIYENSKEMRIDLYFPTIVDTPRGRKQPSCIDIFDHEYIEPSGLPTMSASCYDGNIYYPIGNKYLRCCYYEW
jgi:hypothetical protein